MKPFVQSFMSRGIARARLSAQSLRSLRSQEEVEMEDLSPPDHHGPPSYGRASRQSR